MGVRIPLPALIGDAMVKKAKGKTKPKKDTNEGFKGIVRIGGVDIIGQKVLWRALKEIKGIGFNTAKAAARVIEKELGIKSNEQVGNLNEQQIAEIDKIIASLHNYLPTHLINRRSDPVDGKDKHLITDELIFANREDIEREKEIYSWRGFRHAHGQKVRGQRTKNTGRRGIAVGVKRKK